MTATPYIVFGYGSKQVRDDIHSHLVAAFEAYRHDPKPAAVYNIGGGRRSNCSVLEAIEACEQIAGRPLDWSLDATTRIADHRWWISVLAQFEANQPAWGTALRDRGDAHRVHELNAERWAATSNTL